MPGHNSDLFDCFAMMAAVYYGIKWAILTLVCIIIAGITAAASEPAGAWMTSHRHWGLLAMLGGGLGVLAFWTRPLWRALDAVFGDRLASWMNSKLVIPATVVFAIAGSLGTAVLAGAGVAALF